MANKDGLSWGMAPLGGKLSEKWPKYSDGGPVRPKLLTHSRSNDFQDIMLINMLEAYGIPAFADHPGDGTLGKVVLGMSGFGSNIYVPETMYEDAITILEAEPDDELQS